MSIFPILPTLAADLPEALVPILVGLAGLVVGAVCAMLVLKALGSQTLGAAKRQAEELLKSAKQDSDNVHRKAELDIRDELAKRRVEFEKETETFRNELKEAERRIAKREDNLDRKLDVLTTKEKYLDELNAGIKKREGAVAQKEEQIDQLLEERRELLEKSRDEQKQVLLRLTNLSPEEARKQALKLVEDEVQHEAGQIIQRQMQRAEEESKEHALRITLQAIQRYASEHTSESTVSAIPIPSDDMKGRVIGREGRNIRAFEKATGVDVIVDDTPGVIVVSCFDPVRRAVAAESLQKLLEDGRIHPARIEEVVEQINKDMAQRILKFGKEACIEANIQGLHPKAVEMVGRLHYRLSYGQNIMRHSIETAYLCQVIADELHLDGTMARRCGFLHDIGKAMDHNQDGTHAGLGAEFCKRYGVNPIVVNAIAAHHHEIDQDTVEAVIAESADAISGARPGARREDLEAYIKRIRSLEEMATSFDGVQQAFAIQAGREVRILVKPEAIDDLASARLARDVAKKIEETMQYPGQIRVTVIRETRTTEYAK